MLEITTGLMYDGIIRDAGDFFNSPTVTYLSDKRAHLTVTVPGFPGDGGFFFEGIEGVLFECHQAVSEQVQPGPAHQAAKGKAPE